MGLFIYAESSPETFHGLNTEALVPCLILPYTKNRKFLLLKGILESHKVQNKCQIEKTIDQQLEQPGSTSYLGHCAHINSFISCYLYFWHCFVRYLYKLKFQCKQYVNNVKTIKSVNLYFPLKWLLSKVAFFIFVSLCYSKKFEVRTRFSRVPSVYFISV